MTRREAKKGLTRTLRDFFISLGVFALVVVVTSADGSGSPWSVLAEPANIAQMMSSDVDGAWSRIDLVPDHSQSVYRGTNRGTAMLILALVFSSIVAFNLWFFRHLRRVYASSRRSEWRIT
jgi:hypothetical protein